MRLALTHASVPYVGYVLRRIQKPPADAKDLQIEHIYPQTPSDEWSGDGGQTKWGELTNAQQAELRTVLNTIGNLTLLEAPLNQGAGNRPFLKKATKYYPCSLVPEMVELKSKTRWDHDAIKVRTAELIDRFLEIWARPSDVPMDTPDDLVRVVDLSIPYGMADPEIFEYVSFEGELWGDVHTIKELLARVGYTLWLRDSERFLATTQGGLVHKTRTPSTKYVVLPDGQLMYAAWATHYLLEAVQEALTTFGLDDLVRVKLLPSS